jgi:hypothetical protein
MAAPLVPLGARHKVCTNVRLLFRRNPAYWLSISELACRFAFRTTSFGVCNYEHFTQTWYAVPAAGSAKNRDLSDAWERKVVAVLN